MLARGNSIRNPQRTASTASALMIGLTLVTLVSVLAAGLKTTFEDSVNKLFTADYALTSQNGFAPTSTASEVALRHLPGVEFLAGVRAAQGKAFSNHLDWLVGGYFADEKLTLRDNLAYGADYARYSNCLVAANFAGSAPTILAPGASPTCFNTPVATAVTYMTQTAARARSACCRSPPTPRSPSGRSPAVGRPTWAVSRPTAACCG